MSRIGRRILKVPFKSITKRRQKAQTDELKPSNDKAANLVHPIPLLHGLKEAQSPSSAERTSDKRLLRPRLVGNFPKNLGGNTFSGKLVKSPTVKMGKIPEHSASLFNKEACSSRMVTKDLVRDGQAGSEFLSILVGKGKLTKHKASAQITTRKTLEKAEKSTRFPHAKELRLLQALAKEPLHFLELHGRFGVSKQSVRGLARNHLLVEVWGPKGVGVRFKLSKKGKAYLKELEAAIRYESKIGEKESIRLEHKPFL